MEMHVDLNILTMNTMCIRANSEDPNQTPQNAASD